MGDEDESKILLKLESLQATVIGGFAEARESRKDLKASVNELRPLVYENRARLNAFDSQPVPRVVEEPAQSQRGKNAKLTAAAIGLLIPLGGIAKAVYDHLEHQAQTEKAVSHIAAQETTHDRRSRKVRREARLKDEEAADLEHRRDGSVGSAGEAVR